MLCLFFPPISVLPVSYSTLQVTYRVVQVTDQHLEGRDDGGGAVSVVSTAAFTGAPQAVAQVLQSPTFIDRRDLPGYMDCF